MKKRIISFITATIMCIACTITPMASESTAETEMQATEASETKTLEDFGITITEEQLNTLIETIKETVTTEYLEPNGIAPADFEWEKPTKEYNEVLQQNVDSSVFWNGVRGDEVLTYISTALMVGNAEEIPELPDNANLNFNGTYDLVNALYRGMLMGVLEAEISAMEFIELTKAWEMIYNEEECFPFGQFIVNNVKFE